MTETRSVPSFPERLGNVLRIAGTIVASAFGALFVAGLFALIFNEPWDDARQQGMRITRVMDGMIFNAQVFLVALLVSRVGNYLLTGRKPWPLNRKTGAGQ